MIDTELSPAEKLSRFAQEAAAAGGNEAELRAHLWLFFQPWAITTVGLEQSSLKQEGKTTAGRFDSRIGSAIIEYKKPGLLDSQSERAKAARQAQSYVDDPAMGAKVVVLTDGTTWAHYRDSNAEPEVGEQASFDFGVPSSSNQSPIDRFVWRGNDVDSCQRILMLIQSVRSEPVNSKSVAMALGANRAEVLDLLGLLGDRVATRQPDSRTDTLFSQWILLAGVSYGIETADAPWPTRNAQPLGLHLSPVLGDLQYAEALFTLHTYVALASKLIGAELLSIVTLNQKHRPSEWSSLPENEFASHFKQLESGATPVSLRCPGLFAGDFFGWYATLLSNDPQLLKATRRVTAILGDFAWARVTNSARGITGDLLRDFYAAVVPRSLRKALGEFFTPQWLAERTLHKGVELAGKAGKSASVVDPSCGSGTFLVAALHRELAAQDIKNPKDRARSTRDAIQNVVGFDINPVAVLMSRINILLALGDRLELLTEVSPRVYQADSILLPDPILGQQQLGASDFRRLPLAIGNIDVPSSIASLGGLGRLRENIEAGVERKRSEADFRARLEPDLAALGLDKGEIEPTLDAALLVYRKIVELDAAGRNGVWARIIEQSFAPATIEQVDLVVGNPPWVSWKDLPQSWQDRSQPLWQSWGLWAGRGSGGGVPLSDIASLLVARSIVTYAKEGSVVAFVLPESFLRADPGNERIRRAALAPSASEAPVRFRALAVDDWTAIKPFSPDAANLPISIYLKTRVAPKFPVPVTVWTRRSLGQRLDTHGHWGNVEGQLKSEDAEVAPVDPNDHGSAWVRPGNFALLTKGDRRNHYVWGQGFNTRGADGLFYVRIVSARPDPDGLVLVRTNLSAGRGNSDFSDRTVPVEARFLWPLVRGTNVDHFSVRESGEYVIVPHDPSNTEKVLSVSELVAQAPKVYDLLEEYKAALSSRPAYQQWAPTEEHPWSLFGPFVHLTRATTFVLSRYMSPDKMPPIAVRPPLYDPKLGFVTACYPNNKTHFHVPSSIQEAHFLAAWMNSTPAQAGIARTASPTAISSIHLQRIPVPAFDTTNADHSRICQIGTAAADGDAFDMEELDRLVLGTAITAKPTSAATTVASASDQLPQPPASENVDLGD